MCERTTAEQDDRTQRLVLQTVLVVHPALLTEAELVCMLETDAELFEAGDAVKRAVEELCSARLLHRCGPLVVPSYAAVRFHALEQADSAL